MELHALAAEPLKTEYEQYNELFWREDFLPRELVAAMAAEAEALRPHVHRARVPGYKKSGSVSAFQLRERAPNITRLYEDPELRRLLGRICGAELTLCRADDPHAYGLYYYTEPGDRIGWHYDTSHYAGSRYTVLVGLVNRSKAALLCQPYKKSKKDDKELRIATDPGTFVFFNGNNIYHSVSAVGEGEERIVLTLEYVTDTRMNPIRRLISNFKDAATYFGFGAVYGGAKKAAR